MKLARPPAVAKDSNRARLLIGTRSAAVVAFLLSTIVSLSCGVMASEYTSAAPATGVEAKAALGENFSLRPGEWASIEGEPLRVGFIGVTGDSRCPTGERCVWEGDATVKIWLEPRGGSREEREISISGKESGQGGGSRYKVRVMRLDPRPVSGRPIEPSDYSATLQVLSERAPAIS